MRAAPRMGGGVRLGFTCRHTCGGTRRYLTDEAGNRLTDPGGNLLTEG